MRVYTCCTVGFTAVVSVLAMVSLILGGCANEPDENPAGTDSGGTVAVESFTRSEFARYEIFSAASLSYRQDLPHRVDVVFYGVVALAGENASVRIPMFLLSSSPPILTVTVDESMESETLLSGVLTADLQTNCGTPHGACSTLASAEVIFRTAEGAAAFNAAFAAARFPQ